MAEERDYKAIHIAFQHAKHHDPKLGPIDVIELPITCWDAVLGAPRVLTKDTIADNFPAEYALLAGETISLDDAEYQAAFGDL